MSKIFLDANKVVDILAARDRRLGFALESDRIYASPLSVHVYGYIFKRKMPDLGLDEQLEMFTLVSFNDKILLRSIAGPTDDLEDNIQLHSAAEAGCDVFLTNDKKLLKMKFFGVMRIENKL